MTPGTAPVADATPAATAKAALRRLAVERAEPTPENYARAYALEQGLPPPEAPSAGPAVPATAVVPVAESGEPWAALIDRLVRGLERGGRQWTSARKKDSLQRVLGGSRADARKLLQRLDQLVGSWDGDDGGTTNFSELPAEAEGDGRGGSVEVAGLAGLDARPRRAHADAAFAGGDASAHDAMSASGAASARDAASGHAEATAALADTVQAALAPAGPAAAALGGAIVDAAGAPPLDDRAARAMQQLCREARLTIEHRHDAYAAMAALCRELTDSLCDLAEDDSWARGQCAAMQTRLDEGLTARGVRSVSALLHDTRARQAALRAERAEAREALKALINRLLAELVDLGSQTGRFHDSVGRHAAVIERADTLEGLTVAVRALVEESREVQSLVGAARQRLHDEHARAQTLTARVATLEAELRRLSDEVVTDQLTQVANRRGLAQAFGTLTTRGGGAGTADAPLCIGLLDIDNFKRLNDELGHTAGDEALKALAAAVAQALRPADVVARYGGEEFVVLLPSTDRDAGQTILTRLQRSLSGGLFLHEGKQVFVTFSAGVTLHLPAEPIEDALERADRALYEAKRTGKNRTCVA